VNIFRMIAGKKGMPNLHVVLTDPPLGGLTALMVLGLSALMPSIFTNANILLTPAVQPFLSLFAGAFSEPILKWIQVKLNKILKTQKESE